MKVSAGIVLYNPDVKRLNENIAAIVNQVDRVILVDNQSENYNQVFSGVSALGFNNKVKWIRNDENLGIAKALNQICQDAINSGEQWVLTLDQDSVCPGNIIESYLKYSDESNVALICPAIMEKIIGRQLTKSTGDTNEKEYVDRCITSAAFTNLDIWQKIDGFREELFIDYVDFDYCTKAIIAGYKIIRINSVVLNHKLGDCRLARLGTFKIRVSNHSAFRKYYIARNIVIYIRRYKKNINMFKERLRLIKVLLITMIFEKGKKEKLKNYFKGIRDGVKFKINS